MDAVARGHYRNLPPSAAPYSPANQSKGKNARIVVGWAMRNLTPSLRRVSADVIIVGRIQDPQFLSFSCKPRSKSMAAKNDQLHRSTMKGKEQEKQEKEESVNRSSPPPPLPQPQPEKPEPGDFRGNGCVRCVWDLYYEELEAYNKLYKSNSKNSISKSS
ncbi:hypothetical protein SLE2022_360480 [Rubroshorea leprosula]